jgi:hypothetical protein
MTLQQNTDRILTTHIGSLPLPHEALVAALAQTPPEVVARVRAALNEP